MIHIEALKVHQRDQLFSTPPYLKYCPPLLDQDSRDLLSSPFQRATVSSAVAVEPCVLDECYRIKVEHDHQHSSVSVMN